MDKEKQALLLFKDKDIATIEALHDKLLDSGTLQFDGRTLTESRELTKRMYEALKWGATHE